MVVICLIPAIGARSADARTPMHRPSVGHNIRVDNLTLPELDAALAKAGLPKHARVKLVEQERQRRLRDGEGPIKDDAPADAFHAKLTQVPWWTLCQDDEGCTVTWQGRNYMYSRWYEYYTGWWAWTPPLVCPMGWKCVVMSTQIASPWRRWYAMQAQDSSGYWPVWMAQVCTSTA